LEDSASERDFGGVFLGAGAEFAEQALADVVEGAHRYVQATAISRFAALPSSS
jgi:hypothetical protein